MSGAERRWLLSYLAPLKGCKVTGVSINADGYPTIDVEKKPRGKPVERYTLEVGRDAEGNGPGWLFGLPRPS
jgi:hypothetical protein